MPALFKKRISQFILAKKPKRNYYYHPHFTDKKTEAERSKLVTLVNSRARI